MNPKQDPVRKVMVAGSVPGASEALARAAEGLTEARDRGAFGRTLRQVKKPHPPEIKAKHRKDI
jgi:hypothetical protein